MDKIVKFQSTHEGRDKFNKAVQYLLKILISSSSNKDFINWLTPAFSIFFT